MSSMKDSILNEETQKIINTLQSNPELKNCILEMIDIAQSPLGTLDSGDDAEEMVVNIIQKTGNLILQEWAQKKSNEAAQKTKEQPKTYSHGKKK